MKLKTAITQIRVYIGEQPEGLDAWVDIEFDDLGGGVFSTISFNGDGKENKVSFDPEELNQLAKIVESVCNATDVLSGTEEMTDFFLSFSGKNKDCKK